LAQPNIKQLNPAKTEKKRKTKRSRGSGAGKNAFKSRLRNDRQDALRRAGIDDPAQVENLPRVSSILRFARGGLATVLTWLRASVDEDARKFVQKYDEIRPRDRRYVRWEEIAFACNLDPYRLLEVAVSVLVKNGETVGQIISATSHPMVVRKSVEMALTDGGFKDRRSLLSARGFLPVPRSATIFNRVEVANFNQQNGPQSDAKLPEMEDDLKDIHGLLMGDVR
jgi:hypothetical protein